MKTSWIQRNSLLTLQCDVLLTEEESENYTLEWRKDNKLIFSAYGNEDSGHSIESMQVSSNNIKKYTFYKKKVNLI
uniref:Ig-like domain-containing protein n=1 Tax=Strongyloides stercoralis TaxID=6248 RepID=A0A0K0E5X0_STRER